MAGEPASGPVEIAFIEPRGSAYEAELDLRYRVLRAPLGMAPDTLPTPGEERCLHLVARSGAATLGCVLFRPESARAGRLFQMAVDPARQRQGLGARLVARLEQELAARGYREVRLHARESALGFYARLGYEVYGEPFIEVDLPHRHMTKALQTL